MKPLDLIPIVVGEDGLYLDTTRLRAQSAATVGPSAAPTAAQSATKGAEAPPAWFGENEMQWWYKNRHNLGSLSVDEGSLFAPGPMEETSLLVSLDPNRDLAADETPSAPGAWEEVPTSGPGFAHWDELGRKFAPPAHAPEGTEPARPGWIRTLAMRTFPEGDLHRADDGLVPLWTALATMEQRDVLGDTGPMSALALPGGMVCIEMSLGVAEALRERLEESLSSDDALEAMFGSRGLGDVDESDDEPPPEADAGSGVEPNAAP